MVLRKWQRRDKQRSKDSIIKLRNHNFSPVKNVQRRSNNNKKRS